MGGVNHDFLENGREIFLRWGLDRANQVEIAHRNWSFGATIFSFWSGASVQCATPLAE